MLLTLFILFVSVHELSGRTTINADLLVLLASLINRGIELGIAFVQLHQRIKRTNLELGLVNLLKGKVYLINYFAYIHRVNLRGILGIFEGFSILDLGNGSGFGDVLNLLVSVGTFLFLGDGNNVKHHIK